MSQQINLLNPLLKRQRDFLSLLTMLQALGFIIAGSLLFYGYAFYTAKQLSKEYEENIQRYNAEQTRLALFAKEFSPQRSNEILQAEVTRLEKELEAKKELGDALKSSAGGGAGGFSEYMRAFSRQIVQGLWLTGFRVGDDGMEISLNGRALAPELLPIYIQRLGKEPVLQGKIFSTLEVKVGTDEGVSSGSALRYVEFRLDSKTGDETKK
ncbi:MAG: PilN domain-containing protein [Gallionella sp.]